MEILLITGLFDIIGQVLQLVGFIGGKSVSIDEVGEMLGE